MNKVLGNLTGLKSSQVAQLSRLYRRRVPTYQIFTYELAEQLVAAANETKRIVAVLVNRAGHVTHVVVGDGNRVFLIDARHDATPTMWTVPGARITAVAFDHGTIELAMAAHRCGGRVIAEVNRVVPVGAIHPRMGRIPGRLVDAVVVQPRTWEDEQEQILHDAAEKHMSTSTALLETCIAAHQETSTGLAPETIDFSFSKIQLPNGSKKRTRDQRRRLGDITVPAGQHQPTTFLGGKG